MSGGLTCAGKLGLADGEHSKHDTYMLALYSKNPGDPDTYTPTGEVRGQGYTAGGIVLTKRKSGVDSKEGFAYISWLGPIRWEVATIKASAALIYNASKGNRSVAVFDFGEVVTSTNGPFVIPTPPDSPDGAMIRID